MPSSRSPLTFSTVRIWDAAIVGLAVMVLAKLFYANAMLASSVVDGTRYFWLDDDMMISMQYARNFAEGNGLVWNPGERVEGYTNFLWTVVMAGVHLLPVKDATVSLWVKGIGFMLTSGAFYLSARFVRQLAPRSWLATPLLFVGMALCPDVIHWSVWGFESSLLAFLNLVFLVRVVEKKPDAIAFLALSLIPITRSDCAYLFFADAIVVLWLSGDRRRTMRQLAVALVPFAAHLAFRRIYYGDWLPNTYYLKVFLLDDATHRGALYLRGFFLAYSILLLLATASAFAIARRDDRAIAFFSTLVVTCGYVVFTGGDMFFEFRFFAHIMPVVFVFAAAGVQALAPTRPTKLVWAGVVILISVPLLGPFDRLIMYDTNGDPREALHVALLIKKNAKPTSSVAVITAGLIPYFSHLRAIDVLGKSDRHIARLSPFPGSMVGHGKLDPAYTLGKKPDLVVSCRSYDFARGLTTDMRTTDVVGSFLAARAFREEYLTSPIVEKYLLEKTAVYTHEGSPEVLQTSWSSVDVAE